VIGGQVSWLLPLAIAGLLAGLWLTRRAVRTDRERAGWLLWGGWTAVCGLVFTYAQGIFHPYYTVQLAPGIAALAGAGSVALWRAGQADRRLRAALPVAIAGTAAWAVVLLWRTPAYLPALRPLVAVVAIVAVAGLALGPSRRWPAVPIVAAGLATVALSLGPAAYAVTTVRDHVTGSTPMAGPFGPHSNHVELTAHQVDPLVDYLEAHRGHAAYLVATFGATASDPVITFSGQPVMTIGGFKDVDPVPTVARFRALAAEGDIRFVLMGPGKPKPLRTWIAAHGRIVDPHGVGLRPGVHLYDVSSRAARPPLQA